MIRAEHVIDTTVAPVYVDHVTLTALGICFGTVVLFLIGFAVFRSIQTRKATEEKLSHVGDDEKPPANEAVQSEQQQYPLAIMDVEAAVPAE